MASPNYCSDWSRNWARSMPPGNIVSALKSNKLQEDCLNDLPSQRKEQVVELAEKEGMELEFKKVEEEEEETSN